MDTQMANMPAVKKFLGGDTISMPEFAEFWKACSPDERQQFGDEARSLLS